MRPVNVSLGVGQEFNLGGLVKKIKVRQAIGPIVVKTPSESAPLDLGETITFEQATDQVQIINAHNASNTLELIVISSDEGSLDAAASSVAISNPGELVKQQKLSEYAGQVHAEFWDNYEQLSRAMYGSETILPGASKWLFLNQNVGWFQNATIEIAQGECAIAEIMGDPNYYSGASNTTDNQPTPTEWANEVPRYYEGERLRFGPEDVATKVIAAYNTGTVDLKIRWSANNVRPK